MKNIANWAVFFINDAFRPGTPVYTGASAELFTRLSIDSYRKLAATNNPPLFLSCEDS